MTERDALLLRFDRRLAGIERRLARHNERLPSFDGQFGMIEQRRTELREELHKRVTREGRG